MYEFTRFSFPSKYSMYISFTIYFIHIIHLLLLGYQQFEIKSTQHLSTHKGCTLYIVIFCGWSKYSLILFSCRLYHVYVNQLNRW